MPPKDDKPSWLDRLVKALAVAGFLLGLWNLGWQIFTFRWQKEIYEESVAERILARLSASRTFNKKGWDAKGEVAVEVVNIGSRPLYLKSVVIQTENDESLVFYNADAPKGNESTKLLQPSESAKYSQEWDFSEHPLREWPKPPDSTIAVGRKEEVTVEVWTTKKFFSVPHSTLSSTSMMVGTTAPARRRR